ncbi:MAG TPA: glucosamine-6-phosphate deaminase [Pirellulales bacterium]|nr:glucosamine-6-phosphate deaminase [Pirellulales bacterium]
MSSTVRTNPAATAAPPARRVPGTEIPCYVFDSNRELARHVADSIASVIRERNAFGQNAVLGLPTGSTPMGVYRELIRMHREEGLDFSGVVTFNLDEYYGLQPDQLQSYHRWMFEHFFDQVNIPRSQIHIPDGTVPADDLEDYCRRYEAAIERAGGIDVLLLGIGRNGHIGFNEPFSMRHSRTRLATLDPITRRDAASDFFSEENVPQHAITMGLATIFDARKIILIALGEHKAAIIRETAEGRVSDRVPASFLREHPAAAVLLDEAAASQLTGAATPWVLGNVEWTDALIKQAVLWLSDKTGKALLKLDDQDLREHNLHQLLRHHGPAQKVAHRVFRWMMDTIEYHPGGREPKRVICFSPHPDDDVISMGGTLIRLVEDQHEVHVAYMTSGNIAVFDHDAQRVADLVAEFNRLFGIDQEKSLEVERQVLQSLGKKASGEPDSDTVLAIKALIRWSEAKAGAIVAGCREEHLHFLDLPFYRTGTIAKNPVGNDDVRIIRELIERVAPQQIYVAGDLSDPHGTHRVCAEAIFRALKEIEAAQGSRPEALLYRGAWQEWAPHEIEIAVPLSPQDLMRKRNAIFMHESQKDKALFPGSDSREFWQRAEDRNRNTADTYNRLGLPEYYAMEGFVRWNGEAI